MPRHFSAFHSRVFAWVLVLLFLHTQSVMGASMRTSNYRPNEAGTQMSTAGGAGAEMMHALDADKNLSSDGAPCPMKSQMQNASTSGCSGCALCCSAVSELDWPPVTIIREEFLVFLDSRPATCTSFPPFHPPERS